MRCASRLPGQTPLRAFLHHCHLRPDSGRNPLTQYSPSRPFSCSVVTRRVMGDSLENLPFYDVALDSWFTAACRGESRMTRCPRASSLFTSRLVVRRV